MKMGQTRFKAGLPPTIILELTENVMTVYSSKNILAIDCSSSVMKLGLQFGGDRLVKSVIPAEQAHGALIMKGIAQLLQSANCSVSDINAIVVATGPGSFTGLRIGIAAAKGMASALNIPVVGVSLLELAEYKLAGIGKNVKVVLPFKKGAYFVAALKDGKIDEKSVVAVTFNELAQHANGSLVASMGGAELTPHISDIKKIIESQKTDFDASDLIFLGITKLNRHEIPDLAKLEPLYLQKSQAEIKFEQNRGK